MKNLIASLVLLAATAASAAAGPDFVSTAPHGKSLAASPGSRDVEPTDDVTFTHDSAALDESARDQLNHVARWLRRNPAKKLVVEGYTDHLGSVDYNEDLATRRAQSVRWYLMKQGVPSDRVVLVVYGEVGADLAGKRLDRRVVMYATSQTPRQIVRASIDNKYALSAAWTERGALFTEARGRAIATR
ncbi:MAG TPA: OmpA family protein [Kofleriaceae bacterium]|nr:OmpA family protein [Kofleriaceae bacterium]